MRQLLFSFILLLAFKQPPEKIILKTLSGDNITVTNDIIYYNKKPISKPIDDIVYDSKYNRLIEQNSSILLFLEINNTPDFNTLAAYKLTNQKATKLVECVYNDKSQGIGPAPFTDIDSDGKLEFGGFDITEGYDTKDSTYYNPSKYYEINNGTIIFDSTLTKKMDIKINGLYIAKPLDKHGNCCVVIKRSAKKSNH
ncbi:MAG TPA: hypothetical protein VK559_11915 [Ferruginibacter sp.]|nr:hypothetical protein [Ferruginibacter sp.]